MVFLCKAKGRDVLLVLMTYGWGHGSKGGSDQKAKKLKLSEKSEEKGSVVLPVVLMTCGWRMGTKERSGTTADQALPEAFSFLFFASSSLPHLLLLFHQLCLLLPMYHVPQKTEAI